jgi:N-acetylmuramoyl-L-alanine amidase
LGLGRNLAIALIVVIAVGSCGGSAADPTRSSTSAPDTTVAGSATTTTVALPATGGADPTTEAPTTTTRPATSTTTSTAPSPLAGQVVVIDPGHNGKNYAHPDEINRLVDIGTGTKACNTTGTAATDGYSEARLNWEVARLARDELTARGAAVVMTRNDNDGWGPCITERAATGNRVAAGAVISIHADGARSDGRGFHVIYPATIAGLTDDIAAPSLRLATDLREAMLATGMPISDYTAEDGFSERGDLGGLNLSDVPAVFLEMGNMKNAADTALLTDPEFQRRVAVAIADAVERFLGR